jgi:autotransporter-associated beta strand protein
MFRRRRAEDRNPRAKRPALRWSAGDSRTIYSAEPLEPRLLLSGVIGNILVTNNSTGAIGEYTASGATINAALVSGLDEPVGIAVSGSDVFVVNSGGSANQGSIGEYTTSGGTVNADLISGLDSPDGIAIAPIPTASLAAGVLTITDGPGQNTINLAVSAGYLDVTLDNQPVDAYPLSQINSILVNANTGSDTITVDPAAPPTAIVGGPGITTIVTNGDNVTYTNTTGSSGGLDMQGSGILNLVGDNSWTGTTEIDSGTLLVNSNGTIPADSTIIDNGNLDVAVDPTIDCINGDGTLTIESTGGVQLLQTAPGSTSALGNLVINSGGALDITNNALTINETNVPLSQIATWVQDGSIMSSLVTGPDAIASRAVGYGDSNADPGIVPDGDVEVKYTVTGDVNLDGVVNLVDYARALNNFNLTDVGYSDGDILNQGVVNLADLTAILNDFNASLNANGTSASPEATATTTAVQSSAPASSSDDELSTSMAPVKPAGKSKPPRAMAPAAATIQRPGVIAGSAAPVSAMSSRTIKPATWAATPPGGSVSIGTLFSDEPIGADWLESRSSILID